MLAPELVTLDVTLTCSPDPHSFWSNIELSRTRKGGFIFSSGIGKGKVKKLEEEREQKKETLES